MAQRKTLSDDVINPESVFDLPCAYCFVLYVDVKQTCTFKCIVKHITLYLSIGSYNW